ncbi:conserved Plasmodium protein, unknown function [Plasmodium relictum]|uniref:Uncharacterized protein n=1 Tax=Plasmodium relictum TaxID=85471 RepID=A0A1J1HD36_PLARL|nr:conserved Plasmodium protein, unknown function [Plasmodium relictum]CRH03897.1 conserved Plasmodium protein, unknown function [Plasmodium relictum]
MKEKENIKKFGKEEKGEKGKKEINEKEKEKEIKEEKKKNEEKEKKKERKEEEKEEKKKKKEKKEEKEEEEKEEKKEEKEEEEREKESVYVKRIINVEITTEIRNFIVLFIENREEIINWCIKNNSLYSNKINEKTSNIIFNDSKNIEKYLKEKNINIDILSVLIYFYNLYCIHNNKGKINFHNMMYNSFITYRGIYENIDKNSKSFKNLLKEERKYKKIMGNKNNGLNDFFFNYKKAFPYGINLILGLFLTFLSGYYGCLLLGYTKFTTRLICGILFSYITLIVEVIIFIIINEKVENLNKNQICMNSNNGLYEKVRIKEENYDSKKIDEIKEINKHSTLKKRKKT